MPTYLDYASTTPVDARAAAALAASVAGEVGGSYYGNASSAHALGQRAAASLLSARAAVAALVGGSADEICFESCATESINHVLFGVTRAAAARAPRPHVVSSSIEHVAVLACLRELAARGHCDVTLVPPGADGVVPASAILAAVTPATVLVSLQLSNNETGAVQPVAAVAAALRALPTPPPLLHSDASQAAGKLALDVRALGVDFLTLAGHKLYAPKGVGATWMRRAVAPLPPLLHGAGQESGRRAGTESLPLIAALGAAAAAFTGEGVRASEAAHAARLRDRLAHRLIAGWAAAHAPPLVIHGPLRARYAAAGGGEAGAEQPCAGDAALPASLPTTLFIAFPGAFAANVVAALADEVAVSAGAACHSAAPDDLRAATPSHVLAAMKVPRSLALSSIRLSVGRWTTESDVDTAAPKIIAAAVAARETEAGAGLREMAAEEEAAEAAAAAAAAAMPPEPVQIAAAAPLAAALPATEALYLVDTWRFSTETLLVAVLPVSLSEKGDGTPEQALSSGAAAAVPMGPAVPFPPALRDGALAALALRATVAHPQGGGQPGDAGVVVFDAALAGNRRLLFAFHTARKAAGTAAAAAGLLPDAGDLVLHYGAFYAIEALSSWQALADDLTAHLGSAAPLPLAAAAAALDAAAPPASFTAGGTGGGLQRIALAAASSGACSVFISAPARRLAARLHSAGHLLDAAVRRVLAARAPAPQLVPAKGYHFADGAWVEYDGAVAAGDLPALAADIEAACASLLVGDAPTLVRELAAGDAAGCAAAGLAPADVAHLSPGARVRLVAVADARNVCPCGGTHVQRAGEIGRIRVARVTSKKNKTRVSYEVG